MGNHTSVFYKKKKEEIKGELKIPEYVSNDVICFSARLEVLRSRLISFYKSN